MFDSLAHVESVVERASSECELTVGEESLTPRLCRVGLPPGVATVRMGCKVKSLPRRLNCLVRIRPRQPDVGEGNEQLDSKKPVVTGFRVQQADLSLGKRDLGITTRDQVPCGQKMRLNDELHLASA